MVPDPCVDLQCINSTDTCSGGKCYCGSSSSLICDKRSQFPLCLNGSCVCSKTRNQYEKGDGKSQGSCKSNLHKCQPDGKCAECTYDSECSGLSNRCINRICVCGQSSGPCNSTTSNECRKDECVCGENPECSVSLQEIVAIEPGMTTPRGEDVCGETKCSFDVVNKKCISQRGPEVCEKITKYYNPLYIGGEVDSDGSAIDFTCDDEMGRYMGTYQCLGDGLLI